MASFIIIGLTDTHSPSFTEEVMKAIREGCIFSGGKRHHEMVQAYLPADALWIDITVPLEKVFAQYLDAFEQGVDTIVVFASGDPLFYGFANTVRRKIPNAQIRLFPTFNSLQMLAHRLVLPYHDMRIVSLTGRPWQEFDRALIEGALKIGVLTDKEHHPAAIAQRMMDFGYSQYVMYIGEHLGNPEKEHIRSCTLEEASDIIVEYPNCLILQAIPSYNHPHPFGIPDLLFNLLDGREKMITKMPIRLLTLQALELNKHRVFWDIGFCTGSVSIEARITFPHVTVVSFEVRKEGKALMDENSRKFGAPGITTIIGDFLEADITGLPKPDAVFIGGHGGKLKEMMAKVKTVLQPRGCIVMNAVTDNSRQLFTEAAAELGLKLQPSMHIVLNEYNPIDILKVIYT